MGKGGSGGLQWPVKDRGCTDILCCFLFLIFFLGFIAVAGWSFILADPRDLLVPIDSNGEPCGIGERADRPYLFFFDLTRCATSLLTLAALGCNTPQVCVEKCPDENYVFLTSPNSNDHRAICVDGADRSRPLHDLVSSEECAAYYVKSVPLVDRCVPEALLSLVDEAGGLILDGNTTLVDSDMNDVNSTLLEGASRSVRILASIKRVGTQILSDITNTYPYVIFFLCMALIVGLAWILLLRFTAGIIVWLILFLFTVVFAVTTAYSFIRYTYLKDNPPSEAPNKNNIFDIDYVIQLKDTWLGIGIVSAVVLGIALLLILVLWKRLRIAVAVIKQTSKALSYMMSVLLWPLFPLVFQMAFMALAFTSFLHIIVLASGRDNKMYRANTTSNSSESNLLTDYVTCSNTSKLCLFFKYGDDPQLSLYVLIYQVFTWIWIWMFISALSELILGGSFASYYWAKNKPSDIPALPLLKSFARAFRYHLGTVAFGSLIIAILKIIQAILLFLRRKFQKHKSGLADFLLKCLTCCFHCLEKVMLFINRYAYIITAIRGSNFCSSAKKAFSLILENCLRVAVVDGLAWFLLFLSQITITAGISVLAGFFFSRNIEVFDTYVEDIGIIYPAVPIVIVIVGSFTIAHELFAVYTIGVKTIFMSFLLDLDCNDGSAEKPYLMSKELMSILSKKNLRESPPTEETNTV